jgi:fatty-acyl-CoA synthase
MQTNRHQEEARPTGTSSRVAPTLPEAIRQLSQDTQRGFVFVRPDGKERFCSFSDIHEEAARRGAHLVARGLEKGDRVALVIPDGDEFVLSFLGAIYAGVVSVPLVPQLSFKNVETYHETVAHITRASGAKLLLTTEATRPFVEPVLGKVGSLRGIFTVETLAATAPAALDVDVLPDDLAFLQFTSGSTSRPKGVSVTHRNLAANSEAFMIHGLGKDSSFDKGVSWLPLFHDMGLIGFVIGPLFTDIPVVFLPTASFVRAPRIWLDTIHKHRGTITYAPNFAYALVTKRIKEKDVQGLDLSCMRITGCGAEPIQAKTLRDFAERLAPAGFKASSFLPSYGMAEATLAITFVKHGTGAHADCVDSHAMQGGKAQPAPVEQAGSQELVACGAAFPGHEVAIIDEKGQRLEERQVGQIVTCGPSITPGYYEEPELTAQSFKPLGKPLGATASRDERVWLHTGDLGYIADGSLYICGRIKDIIIIRGRNFYPQDIEWVVSELPGVRRGNVVAFAVAFDARGAVTEDGTGEDQLVVCAEAFQSDAAGLTQAIQQAVTEHIGLSVHKVEIVPQGALPRTSSGKPQRRKTRQMFVEGAFAQARAALSSPKTTTPASAHEG